MYYCIQFNLLDVNDLQSFVTIALATAAGGEGDLTKDKLSNLRTVGSGFGALIYGLARKTRTSNKPLSIEFSPTAEVDLKFADNEKDDDEQMHIKTADESDSEKDENELVFEIKEFDSASESDSQGEEVNEIQVHMESASELGREHELAGELKMDLELEDLLPPLEEDKMQEDELHLDILVGESEIGWAELMEICRTLWETLESTPNLPDLMVIFNPILASLE